MKKLLQNIFLFFFVAASLQAQNSLNMTLLSEWDPDTLVATSGGREFNDIWGYVDCEGGEYAIIGSAAKVHFFNITDPADPVEIASFVGGGVTTWRDMKTYGDRAYAVADAVSDGLMIFDLSDLPASVTKTYHSTEFFGQAHNIFIDEDNGRLYAVGTEQSADMFILDIATNPDTPALLGAVSLGDGGSVHDLYVRDNIAYCSHGNEGFYVWDCNDPANPVLQGSIVTGGYNHSNWVSADGQYAIVAEEVPLGRPLLVLDLSDLVNNEISIMHSFKFPLLAPEQDNNVPHNPFLRGQYAIVSYYHDGLQIFDMTDLLNPVQVAWYDSHPQNTAYAGYQGNWGVYPFLPSGNLVISDINEGLLVLSADSLVLEAIEPVLAPEIAISQPEFLTLCEGETAISMAMTTGEGFQWYKDGIALPETGFMLEITESGVYYCETSNGHCSAISDSLAITVHPTPVINVSGSLIVCPGETTLMQSSVDAESYEWLLDGQFVVANGSELLTGIPGEYLLTTTIGDCTATSPPVTIEAKPFPDTSMVINGDLSFCPGGSVQLTASGEILGQSWYKDGEFFSNETSITATEAGIYELEVNDEFCIHTSSPVEVIVFPEMIPELTYDWTYLSSSPGLQYQWYYEGEIIPGATEQVYEPLQDGSYSMEIVDYNGCISFSENINVIVSNVDVAEKNTEPALFPNPFGTNFFLSFPDGKLPEQLAISDINGRNITYQSNAINDTVLEIKTSDWPKGIYFLKYTINETSFARKIVKGF